MSVAEAVGESFGAANGEVAEKLNHVLVRTRAEHHGAGRAEHTHVIDIHRVEFGIIVGATIAVEELPVGAVFMVVGKIARGKELAIVEIVAPDAVGLFGLAREFLLKLQSLCRVLQHELLQWRH